MINQQMNEEQWVLPMLKYIKIDLDKFEFETLLRVQRVLTYVCDTGLVQH